jgi:hypothetical protein
MTKRLSVVVTFVFLVVMEMVSAAGTTQRLCKLYEREAYQGKTYATKYVCADYEKSSSEIRLTSVRGAVYGNEDPESSYWIRPESKLGEKICRLFGSRASRKPSMETKIQAGYEYEGNFEFNYRDEISALHRLECST